MRKFITKAESVFYLDYKKQTFVPEIPVKLWHLPIQIFSFKQQNFSDDQKLILYMYNYIFIVTVN